MPKSRRMGNVWLVALSISGGMMKKFLPVLLLVLFISLSGLIATSESAQTRPVDVNRQVREFQERMMHDQEIMALVLALSADPDIQELLNDPSVLSAINSGDYDSLAKNPRVMRLLENARVREIQRRLGQ